MITNLLWFIIGCYWLSRLYAGGYADGQTDQQLKRRFDRTPDPAWMSNKMRRERQRRQSTLWNNADYQRHYKIARLEKQLLRLNPDEPGYSRQMARKTNELLALKEQSREGRR